MTPYKEKYPAGTNVRIGDSEMLQAFKQHWKYHHPISEEQIEAAGMLDQVKAVSFYHGGDVLYELARTAGIWHEACLEPSDSK